MKKKKKLDIFNLLAAISALFSFIMAVVLIIYNMGGNMTKVKTIIFYSLFGLGVITFIISTIFYMFGTPRLKNKD